MKIALLRNQDLDSVHKWQIACEKKSIEYDVIDLTASGWLEDIMRKQYNFFLVRPPGIIAHFKTLYDERLYIISQVLNFKIYPSYQECYIYENKRLLSYFLQANNIPHPKTSIFYNKTEAFAFADKSVYPIVGKTAIGGSGSGVKILRNKKDARKYIKTAFSLRGIKSRFGPNRVTGSPSDWTRKALLSPSFFINKLSAYTYSYRRGQKDYVIFQEYVPHDFEWRAVKIGYSYFAHKKIKHGDKASGTKGIEYTNPPESTLSITKELCEKLGFNFMAIDYFEDSKGGFLVNELQTIFGHVQNHILEVEGKPGRYIYQSNKWIFEEGEFNTNETYDLRLEVAIDLYKKGFV